MRNEKVLTQRSGPLKRKSAITEGLLVSCILPILMSLSGCVTAPTAQELARLDYGEPLAIDYESAIKSYFEELLFDPYSAHYRFSEPTPTWYKEGLLTGNRLYAGYLVRVGVNAKNRMGGYVGMKTYGFLFKNNQIIRVFQPQELQSW